MADIGNRIKEKREEKQLTQQDVADALFVDRGTISKWERNESVPNILMIKKVADFYGLSIEDLIGIENKDQKENRKPAYDYYELIIIAGFFVMAYLMGPCGVPVVLVTLTATWKRKMPIYVHLLGITVLYYCSNLFYIYFIM